MLNTENVLKSHHSRRMVSLTYLWRIDFDKLGRFQNRVFLKGNTISKMRITKIFHVILIISENPERSW